MDFGLPDLDLFGEQHPPGPAPEPEDVESAADPGAILTEIIRFYCARGIPFLIFGPTLTAFSGFGEDVTYILTDGEITYENGAVVNTSFVTNLDRDWLVRTAPELTAAIKAADKESRAEVAKPVNLKYRYPPEVLTAVMASGWSALGIDFRVRKGGRRSCAHLTR